MIRLLSKAIAFQVQKQGFIPGRLAGREDMFDPRPNIWPDLSPDLV